MTDVTVPATKEAFVLMLKAMPVGLDCRMPNGNGHVKRVNRSDFALFDDSNKERSRWGDLEQIAGDMAFFHDNGCLPPQDMPRW